MTNRMLGTVMIGGLVATAGAVLASRPAPTSDVSPVTSAKPTTVTARADTTSVKGAKPATVTVPQGTPVRLRLQTTVASNLNRAEDPVEAVLTAPIVVDNRVVLPAGSVIRGIVSSAQRSGRVKGRAQLALRFQTIAAGRDRYDVNLAFAKVAPSQKGKDAATIIVPAASGAIAGAIIGGKKGAAIGTAIGGGGGTAVVLATRGKEVQLPRGTMLVLRLQRPVEVRLGT